MLASMPRLPTSRSVLSLRSFSVFWRSAVAAIRALHLAALILFAFLVLGVFVSIGIFFSIRIGFADPAPLAAISPALPDWILSPWGYLFLPALGLVWSLGSALLFALAFASRSGRAVAAARASAAEAEELEAQSYALRQAKSASELKSIDQAAAPAPAESADPPRRRGL